MAETLLRRMAKDLEEKAEIQQAPKREGHNMIMFLTAQNAVGEREKEQAANKAVRTIPAPTKTHRRQGGQPAGLNHRVAAAASANPGLRPGVESAAGFARSHGRNRRTPQSASVR